MSSLFLDTGYVIALEASDDQHHTEAHRHWKVLTRSKIPELVTTTYVFDEIVTFFNSHGRHAKAVEIGKRLLDSPSVRMVQVEPELFAAGWQYLRKRPDKTFSLTDCVSFILMEREGIQEALSFDGHFNQAGFRRLPG
jgi:uncharacterized protein